MPIKLANPLSNISGLNNSGINISSNTSNRNYDLKSLLNVLDIVSQKEDYLDLSDQLKIRNYTHPTISGLSDLDYPSQNNSQSFLNVSQISNFKVNLLPQEIIEIINKSGYSLNIGLFTSINRAYFIVDNNFYLWNYENNTDLITYDGFNDPIYIAELLYPKPSYFKSFIHNILCLISSNSIVLLALSSDNENQVKSSVHIEPEPIADISNDGMIFLDLKSIKNWGRIFLASQDGCLYELYYQLQKNWLGKKAWLINHSRGKLSSFLLPSLRNIFGKPDSLVQLSIDETRNNLFALSESGGIQLFYLGPDGSDVTFITSCSHQETHNRAVAITKLVEGDNFGKIINVSHIPLQESRKIHLVAVTSSGFRYYFATRSPEDDEDVPPYMLKLIHLRFPPGYSASTISSQRPKNVFKVINSSGTTALLTSPTELSDSLWICNSDNFPFKQYLMESQSVATINGKAWSFKENTNGDFSYETPFSVDAALTACLNQPRFISTSSDFNGLPSSPSTPKSLAGSLTAIDLEKYKRRVFQYYFNPTTPEVIDEIYGPPKRYVLLTAQKCFSFELLQPAKFLKVLFLINNGPDSPQVLHYLTTLGSQAQALATCLHLACSLGTVEQQILDWVVQCIISYGNNAINNSTKVRQAPPIITMAQAPPNIYSLDETTYNPQQGISGNESSKATLWLKHQPGRNMFDPFNYNNGAYLSPTVPKHPLSSTPHNDVLNRSAGRKLGGFNRTPGRGGIPTFNVTPTHNFLGEQPSTFHEQRSFGPVPYATDSRTSFQVQGNQSRYQQPQYNYGNVDLSFNNAPPPNFKSMPGIVPGDESQLYPPPSGGPQLAYPIPLSPIQDGLLHYFWRIVRPVWYLPLVIQLSDVISVSDGLSSQVILPRSGSPGESMAPQRSPLCLLFGSNDFSVLACRLRSLETFVANYPQLSSQGLVTALSSPTTPNRSASKAMDISPPPNTNFGSGRLKGRNVSSTSSYFVTPERGSTSLRESEQSMSFNEKIILLIRRTKELASLFKILSEHDLPAIFGLLSPDDSLELCNSTFASLLSNTPSLNDSTAADLSQLDGSHVSITHVNHSPIIAHVITASINYYLTDQSLGPIASDILVKRLQENCPSFYGPDEALIAKANEYLIAASRINHSRFDSTVHPNEKARLLESALQIFKKVADQIDLRTVCAQFANQGSYNAIIELCLEAAGCRDPLGQGLTFYRNQVVQLSPLADKNVSSFVKDHPTPTSKKLYDQRIKFYGIIFGSLKELQTQTLNVPFDEQSVENMRRMETIGPESMDEQDVPLALRMKTKFLDALNLCSRSTDELFHYAFYEWLIENNLPDYLIKIQSPYIEGYLNRLATSNNLQSIGDVSKALELKCKYYERNQDPLSVAKVLITLAERYDPCIILEERVDSMSRALTYARANLPTKNTTLKSPERDSFVQELEEKVEVAKIQLQILSWIEMNYGETDNGRQAITKLNSELYDLTRLYEDFAEPFELWECQLAIIHSAGYVDKALICNIWANVIDSEQLKCMKAMDEGGSLYQSGSQETYPNLVVSAMANKIFTLGKLYAHSDLYFPARFLIGILEKKSFELGYCSTILPEAMIKLGYDMGKLLDIFEDMMNTNVQNISYFLHLSHVLLGIIDMVADNREHLPLTKRRRLFNQCLNLLSSMAIQIQSKIPPSLLHQNGASELLDKITATQLRFQRVTSEQ